jgi:hypothetical protein
MNRDRTIRIVGLAIVAVFVLTILLSAAGAAFGASAPDPTAVPSVPDRCEGSALPQLGCGTEPQASGDRGGVMQWATFGVVMLGLATIGTVIVRSTIRNDRARAAEAEEVSAP